MFQLVVAYLCNNISLDRFLGSGGAACSMPVLQFFEDIGIPICEGYGLTETAPVISSSPDTWTDRRLGCVGVPIPSLDVRIIDPETLQEVPSGSDGEVSRWRLWMERVALDCTERLERKGRERFYCIGNIMYICYNCSLDLLLWPKCDGGISQ